MGHSSNIHSKKFDNNDFKLPSKYRMGSLLLLVVGAILIGLGVFDNLESPARIWSSWLFNNVFFLCIGIAATFFVTSQTLGYNGWYVLVKRVFESVMMYVPLGSLLMIPILAFGLHDIFHWSHAELYDPSNSHYDPILDSKSFYLNVPSFYIRSAIYIILWIVLVIAIRRNSIKSDTSDDIKVYNRSKVLASLFIIVFAVTSSMAAWDWLMSIQPHWYSTLFGWYCFISAFVTCMAFVILMTAALKRMGYLAYVTEEHFHDLGKLMFAFSVAWAYLFFSQFMLIWYSNIPEETMYYKLRIEYYPFIMYACVLLNFIVPFFILITRGAKRFWGFAQVAAILIIIGHWLDFYQMAVPAALVAADLKPVLPGMLEVGFGIFYLGLFGLVIFRALAKAPLVQENHPFVRESLIHHT